MRTLVTSVEARSILTRVSGYLKTVSSHSLQPYRGCSFGRSLCGVGCYVQHNRFLTKGAAWGSFVEAKRNAAALYRSSAQRERRWAHAKHMSFSVFMSSATDPFLPHEKKLGITREVLEAMLEEPPDALILQTHTHLVENSADAIARLASCCDVRVHVSIETDNERLPGLPAHASPVDRRFQAVEVLRDLGVKTVVTVAPLLPISTPEAFFQRIARSADAVVLDHFIGGDGSKKGSRTNRTPLPALMQAIDPQSISSAYLEQMLEAAKRAMPGRVGVGIDGFAGRFLA